MTSAAANTRSDANRSPRTVLITGAAKRIGRAIAQDLAAHGWQVAVHYRSSKTEADELVDEIRSSGGVAETLTRDSWLVHLDTNLKAPVFLAQAMARHLPKGCEGNVINLIDQRVWNLNPDFFSYTISQAGLWTATRTLAQTLAPRIRVNAIAPGQVLGSIHQTEADFAAECASTLMGRGPSPTEIADAVRFIIGAPAMTGQMIALDGGQHLT
jgi:NAD(P)-dependent dehydrogenase (short-subunit alcohol dehydrogenase family)